MISRATVDEVLLRTDIETLVGGYVSLKRSGSNLKGLCPFHSEKTPSFTVYPADNSFCCFGCGVGGNAITFTRQIEHMDFQDAVEFLAKRAGITVLYDEKGENREYKKFDKSRIYNMNRDAARFFHNELYRATPGAKEALRYFTEVRGLSSATIKHFGLGYSPDSFTDLMRFMLSRGYTYDELEAGYLIRKSDKGKYYDAFRGRVMFPIIDVAGNVIAFGGRTMQEGVPNKYLNSTDTPVFKKSRNLYALNFARLTCQETLILCEGYMDVIALHAAGFTNAVAALGTAFTSEQARIMSRYTKKVVITYDSDGAGQKAAARAIKILEDVGLEVSILNIPGAKDPDEYIKKFGREKFEAVLQNTKTKFEYNMDSVLSKFDINIPQDKINALSELEKVISDVYSEAERDIYIRVVAKQFDVDHKSIKSDVERIISRRRREAKKSESMAVRQEAVGYADKVNPSYIKAPIVARNEENLLGLLLVYPEHRKRVFEEKLLTEEDFFTELSQRIFRHLKESYCSDNDEALFFDEAFSPEEVGRITKMKISRMQLSGNGDDVLYESIKSLKDSMAKEDAGKTDSIEALNKLLDNMRFRED